MHFLLCAFYDLSDRNLSNRDLSDNMTL